jgi:hypothetical protein
LMNLSKIHRKTLREIWRFGQFYARLGSRSLE